MIMSMKNNICPQVLFYGEKLLTYGQKFYFVEKLFILL